MAAAARRGIAVAARCWLLVAVVVFLAAVLPRASATGLRRLRVTPSTTGGKSLSLAHPVPIPGAIAFGLSSREEPVEAAPALTDAKLPVEGATAQLSSGGTCTPKCTWQCQSPKCDQVCEPTCQAPRCETRCQAADTSGCETQCDEPQCSVMCPKRQCAAPDCAECKTTCSEPMCFLKCPKAQPCRNVCEHPVCDWTCRSPTECPKPLCKMICENPRDCSHINRQFHDELPPLETGEVTMNTFKAPPKVASPAVIASAPEQILDGVGVVAAPTRAAGGASPSAAPAVSAPPVLSPPVSEGDDEPTEPTAALVFRRPAGQPADVERQLDRL